MKLDVALILNRGSRWAPVFLGLVLYICSIGIGTAQYLYLDSTGDGISTKDDRVAAGGETRTVDIWIVTDMNADGGPVRLPLSEREQLTINSYSFTLVSEGGTVAFSEYENLQQAMNLPLRGAKSETEFHTGFAGAEILPAGKYHLGRLTYRVLTGDPQLRFSDRSNLDARFITSFGSKRKGNDEDNTLKLGTAVPGSGMAGTSGGDWSDTAGLGKASGRIALEGAALDGAPEALKFSATVRGNADGRIVLAVTATRPSHIFVGLFDVRGRLVRTVANVSVPDRGTNQYTLGDTKKLGRGVYFYRVVSDEGTLTGRVPVLK